MPQVFKKGSPEWPSPSAGTREKTGKLAEPRPDAADTLPSDESTIVDEAEPE